MGNTNSFFYSNKTNFVVATKKSSPSSLPICEGSPVANKIEKVRFWDDCMGIFSYSDGSIYSGKWKNGKKHGYGTYLYANGSKFEGEYRNGVQDGKGILYGFHGAVTRGQWKDKKFLPPHNIRTNGVETGKPKGVKAKPFPTQEFRVALVIGNGDYGSMGTLHNPPNDARLIANTLENLGFKVTKKIDATQKEMKKAVLRFSRQLRENPKNRKIGLFYYAGHGVQSSGRNYLIPVDARIDSEGDIDLESVSAGSILASMHSAGAEINFVILDACRNNPYVRSFRSAARGLAMMDSPKGTLVAYATSPGEIARDGNQKHSPYTLALAAAMKNRDPVEKMFRKVRNRVMQMTKNRQIPWEASSLTGDDFYFAVKK